jgi:flagellar basal body rod protein FlgG
MRGMLAGTVFAAALAGCQSGSASKYVTQDQLQELLALPERVEALEPSGQQREKVDALVLASFTAPDLPTQGRDGAAALAVADRRLEPLAKALTQIDAAVQVCATNLANVETTAYKATCAASRPDGTVEFRTNVEQGSLQNTGRQLDVGISGQGLFRVKVLDSIGDGTAYTRNGNFFVNRDGELVLGMGDGYRLDPKIIIPKGVTDVSISGDGQVEVVQPDANRKLVAGQVKLYQFMNPESLNHLGGSLFTQTDKTGSPMECRPGDGGAGQLLQGFLESSNVDPTKERLRIRFLQNWRNTILKAIDDAK